MRAAIVCALLACGLTACRYDYDALRGLGAGGSGAGGTAVPAGQGGAGGESSAGGNHAMGGDGDGGEGGGRARGGAGGDGGLAGHGGSGMAGAGGSGGANEGGAAGAAGRGGAGGSAGGTGGAAGRGGAGGTSGSGGGRGGAGGANGGSSAGGAGGTQTGGSGGAIDAGVDHPPDVNVPPEPDLVLWYKFDDGTGTVAHDSSSAAGAPRDGMLVTAGTGGAVAFSATHQVGTQAVSLTANGSTGGGYVVVPSLAGIAPGALTLSAWVNVSSSQRWQRVVDIGNGTTSNIALTTQNGTDAVRFIIRTGTVAQEIASTVVLPLSTWHHLAVVLPDGATYTGTLYVDGVAVATNPAMTLHAADLGATIDNFLGKSQFTADPYFSGFIDDFRVYRRALTGEQIAALYAMRGSG